MREQLCSLAQHPEDDPDLSKDARKLWLKIDRLADSRFAVTSSNDRAMLYVAERADIVLVSEDGPLRGLAQERGKMTLDVLDVLAILCAHNALTMSDFDKLLAKEAARQQRSVTELREDLASRGRDHWPCGAAPANRGG
jgi:hypothetical protein